MISIFQFKSNSTWQTALPETQNKDDMNSQAQLHLGKEPPFLITIFYIITALDGQCVAKQWREHASHGPSFRFFLMRQGKRSTATWLSRHFPHSLYESLCTRSSNSRVLILDKLAPSSEFGSSLLLRESTGPGGQCPFSTNRAIINITLMGSIGMLPRQACSEHHSRVRL